jgi:transposase
MTVPGVNVIVAATFVTAVGDVRRFPNSRKLVGYLGLDPEVRQSGGAPAKHGRASKQGSASGRHALVEAAWSAVRAPGPPRAFYQRIRARRGHQIAIVAAARKLACRSRRPQRPCTARGRVPASGSWWVVTRSP